MKSSKSLQRPLRGSGQEQQTVRHSAANSTLEKTPKNPAVLILWIEENFMKLYPTEKEKRELAHYAGMTQRQVQYWFSNARRQIKKVGYTAWKASYSARFSVAVTQDSNSETGSSADCVSKEQEVKIVNSAPPLAVVKPLTPTSNAKKATPSKLEVLTQNHRGFQPYFFPAHLTVPHRAGMTVGHLNTQPDFNQLQNIHFGNRGPPVYPPAEPLQTICYPATGHCLHHNKPPAVLIPPFWSNTCPTSAPASLITPIIDSVVTTVENNPISSNELMKSTDAVTLESTWGQSNLPSTRPNDSLENFNATEYTNAVPPPQKFSVAWLATTANYPTNKPTGTTANSPQPEAFH